MRRLGAALLVLLSTAGCAAHGIRMAPALDALRRGEAPRAVELVDRDPEPGSVLWQMERGLLLRAARRYRESNEAFATAERLDDDLYTRSVSNEAAALAVSDALRPYRALRYDRPFLHVYSILNYLDLGDREGALVEARALSGLLERRVAAGEEDGPTDWGFGRLVAGLVFESAGEWNDAWIAYRAARAAWSGGPAPGAARGPDSSGTSVAAPALHSLLEAAIARTGARAGLSPGADPGSGRPRLVVVVEEGLVPVLEDFHLRVPILRSEEGWGEDRIGPWGESVGHRACSMRYRRGVEYHRPDVAYFVDLALPTYPDAERAARGWPEVRVGTHARGDAIPVEDVGSLARADLERRLPGIAVRAATREILEVLASRAASRHSGKWAGELVNLVGVVTERADTRCWTTLPVRIGLAVLEVDPGASVVEVVPADGSPALAIPVSVREDGWTFVDCRFWP